MPGARTPAKTRRSQDSCAGQPRRRGDDRGFGRRPRRASNRTPGLPDVVLSFPYLLFALALVSIIGPSLPLSIVVIAFFSWASVGRVIRGQTLSLREKEFVEADRSLGAGDLRIMFVDILPNLTAPIVVYATLLIPLSIVFEATLSFLGLGIVPPTPAWGEMLSDSVAYYKVAAWWFVLAPGAALLITTLAFNLFGDGIRDALDPRGDLLLHKSRRS